MKHQILEVVTMRLCGIAVLNWFSVIIYLSSYFLFLNLSPFHWCMFSLSSFWHLSLSFPSNISCCACSCPFLCRTLLPVPFPLPTPLTGVYSGVCAAVRVCVWIAATLAELALLELNNLVPVAMWTFSRLPLPNPLHLSPSPPTLPCKTAWKHKFT